MPPDGKKKPFYKRILLKIGGEALQGKDEIGLDSATLEKVAAEL